MQIYGFYVHANYEANSNIPSTVDVGCKRYSESNCMRIKVQTFAIAAFAGLTALVLFFPKILFNTVVYQLSKGVALGVAYYVGKNCFTYEHSSRMFGAFQGGLNQ